LKTAIVRGLALRIASGNVPRQLVGRDIYILDVSTIMDNTYARGTLESKIIDILASASNSNCSLFIDEIHGIVGTGAQGGNHDIANQFKTAMAQGSVSIIGATTLDEYRKYIEQDGALERRMGKVEVDEPTEEDAVLMLGGMKPLYERHHMVSIPEDIISLSVSLAKRYITDRYLPDSGFDVLDIACIRAQSRSDGLGCTTIPLEEWYGLVKDKKFREASINKPRYRFGRSSSAIVTVRDVEDSVSSQSHRAVFSNVSDQIRNMEKELLNNIVGQDIPIANVCSNIRTSYIYNSGKTLGGILLVGSSGVGN